MYRQTYRQMQLTLYAPLSQGITRNVSGHRMPLHRIVSDWTDGRDGTDRAICYIPFTKQWHNWKVQKLEQKHLNNKMYVKKQCNLKNYMYTCPGFP